MQDVYVLDSEVSSGCAILFCLMHPSSTVGPAAGHIYLTLNWLTGREPLRPLADVADGDPDGPTEQDDWARSVEAVAETFEDGGCDVGEGEDDKYESEPDRREQMGLRSSDLVIVIKYVLFFWN